MTTDCAHCTRRDAAAPGCPYCLTEHRLEDLAHTINTSYDLRATIIRTLANHVGEWIDNGGPDGHCKCGHRGRLGEFHPDHVAEALTKMVMADYVLVPKSHTAARKMTDHHTPGESR